MRFDYRLEITTACDLPEDAQEAALEQALNSFLDDLPENIGERCAISDSDFSRLDPETGRVILPPPYTRGDVP